MNQVVDVARTWIGTPYVHQASSRKAGTDCLGLIRGVWREVLGAEPEAVPAYTEDWAEPQGNEVLLGAADRHLIRLPRNAAIASGDVLLFRLRDTAIAKHMGIVGWTSPRATFIHAYSGYGVVESSLSEPWRRRIAATFRFPNMQTRED